MIRNSLLLFLLASLASAADVPQTQISNKAITAKFYLPDSENGYYRGTRFDWSGVLFSLRANGHEYFGQWFDNYDPKLHDAIQGPVEEFLSNGAGLGYDEAKAGGTFIRIGVGVVRKPEEPAYLRFNSYEIIDSGRWKVNRGRDSIEFIHELRDTTGYGYRYSKKIRLLGDSAKMVIEHTLRNTGRKPILTQQYNHNFFVMDGQPTGPDSSVTFAFPLRAQVPFKPGIAEVQGNKIAYTKELQKGESTYGEFESPGPSASSYDIRVENRKAGSGVRITSDRPIAKVIYWSIRTTLCPEVYIDIDVLPGAHFSWKYNYEFYSLPK
ncbi:MAG: hypothetical protein WKF37_25345 [Bryobacteraceae bacterium]